MLLPARLSGSATWFWNRRLHRMLASCGPARCGIGVGRPQGKKNGTRRCRFSDSRPGSARRRQVVQLAVLDVEQRDRAALQVALVVEGDVAGQAIVVGGGHRGSDRGAVELAGALDRVG